MESPACASCKTPKAPQSCGICECSLCRRCAQFLEKHSLTFLEPLPAELGHRTYCGACYNEKVEPALASYTGNLERAKGVFVYIKGQGEETRLMKRAEKPLTVLGCTDRAETLLRLALSAVQGGFNALLDVEIVAAKVRNAGYQTMRWRGTGVPTRLDGTKLERPLSAMEAIPTSR